MAKGAPNDPCPCGTGRKYKRCCGPLHAGVPAAGPEALMRSRYTAYAVGDAPYLVATTHPASVHHEADGAAWLAELRRYCAATRFEGLEVKAAREVGDTGWVHFVARLRQGAQVHPMEERSRFERVNGRWLYLDGEG